MREDKHVETAYAVNWYKTPTKDGRGRLFGLCYSGSDMVNYYRRSGGADKLAGDLIYEYFVSPDDPNKLSRKVVGVIFGATEHETSWLAVCYEYDPAKDCRYSANYRLFMEQAAAVEWLCSSLGIQLKHWIGANFATDLTTIYGCEDEWGLMAKQTRHERLLRVAEKFPSAGKTIVDVACNIDLAEMLANCDPSKVEYATKRIDKAKRMISRLLSDNPNLNITEADFFEQFYSVGITGDDSAEDKAIAILGNALADA
jgi:hypothetical protein